MKNNGGPAFPSNNKIMDEMGRVNPSIMHGMTLWDYYAAHALDSKRSPHCILDESAAKNRSHSAALIADAMIEEREKRFKSKY